LKRAIHNVGTTRPFALPFLALTAAALIFAACSSSTTPSPESATDPPTRGADQPASVAAAVETIASPEPVPSPWATLPVPADDPVALGEQLATAERAIRDPSVTGAQLAWMGHLQQLVYRRLSEQPKWREIALAAVPDDFRTVARANLSAAVDLRAMVAPTQDLPAWRVIEPAPADELLARYREAEAEFGVPWSYLASIHLIETHLGRVRGTSIAGAQGPMQFMPATWATFGEGNVNDARDAIRAAARYLRASGAPSNMPRALFAYNQSQQYVRAVTAFAEVMRADPDAFRGYYNWQVYYLTKGGDVLLPAGFGQE
jgi:membrane-bound lytic murein transglycosylase B